MRLYTVRFKGKLVGGMICVLNSKAWTSLYLAVRKELLHLSPGYLLYWTVIEEAYRNGALLLDLGRGIPSSGAHRFRQKWRGKDVYESYRYYFRGRKPNRFSPATIRLGRSLKQKLWKRIPLQIANRIGPILRRELPFF